MKQNFLSILVDHLLRIIIVENFLTIGQWGKKMDIKFKNYRTMGEETVHFTFGFFPTNLEERNEKTIF